MINKIQRIIFVILISLIFCCDNLFAFGVPLSFKEMVRKSDLILIGEVKEVRENSWVYVNHTHRIRGSTAEIEVRNVIKGSLGKGEGNNIFVRYLGTSEFWVEDQPEFRNSERVLLFLKKIKGNYYGSVNLYAGKVEISDKNTVWIGDEDSKVKLNENLTIDECIERIKRYMSLEGKNEKK